MVDHKFKILEIKPIVDSNYGQSIIVYANPVLKDENGSIQFSMLITKRTYRFLFPRRCKEELIHIANELPYWKPFDEFGKERIYDSGYNIRVPAYRYLYWEEYMVEDIDKEELQNDNYVIEEIIPNEREKWFSLKQKYDEYRRENSKSEIKNLLEFVEHFFDENPHWLAWLFDNPHYTSFDDLSIEDECKFDEFTDLFEFEE